MVTATVIWVGAGVAIITDGAEAVDIIMGGGIIGTQSHWVGLKVAASVGGLFISGQVCNPLAVLLVGQKREPLAHLPVPYGANWRK